MQLGGKYLDRVELFPELRVVTVLAVNKSWYIVENGRDTQTGPYVNAQIDFAASVLLQRIRPEPTVANDQGWLFESLNKYEHKLNNCYQRQ